MRSEARVENSTACYAAQVLARASGPNSLETAALQSPQPEPGVVQLSTHPLHTSHDRKFDEYRFVYPVLSRRSGGLSLGVNLNPDKVCNFDCIYCQVDRSTQSETQFVEIDSLLSELREMLALVASGEIYETEKFGDIPPALRRLNDIAFSGDGEPTTYKNFDEIIAACAEVKREAGLET